MNTSLTRYPEGSIRELWTISFPLMVSTFAMLFMIFTDRIFLAHYSIDAMNASVREAREQRTEPDPVVTVEQADAEGIVIKVVGNLADD